MLFPEGRQITLREGKENMENSHYAFVLVTDEKYWKRLCQSQSQGKQINFFVRKNSVGPKQTNRLLFYVKKPHMQILGTADFAERIVGDVKDLWSKFGAESIFDSIDEYRAFAKENRKITFIRFENFKEIADPKPKETVTRLLGSLVWFRPRYVSQQTAEQLEGKI